jgi:uncharacterized phage protein gp47/JayE
MTNNFLDVSGLHTETLQEIIDDITAKLQAIYGADINIEPNSPDGQMINIFSQAKIDLLDAIVSTYNSFSPEVAIGTVLDQRCAINGIVRNGATYTRTNITIVTDRVLTLNGLDTAPNNAFTVKDSSGNLFYLLETAALSVGSNIKEFRAAIAGKIETTIATITEIATITLGVISVNNPDSATYTGVNEETDAELRIRRQASVSVQSEGFLIGLTGSLKNITGVIDAEVYENTTDVTDINGILPHSMWAIVDGGENTDIADVIYLKRNAGCGMTGSSSVDIEQVNGTIFTVLFDRPTYEDLYIDVTIQSIDPLHTIDDNYIKNSIFKNFSYITYQPADFTAITTWIKEFDSLAVVISGGVSDHAGDYTSFLYPSTVASKWIMSTTRINVTVV